MGKNPPKAITLIRPSTEYLLKLLNKNISYISNYFSIGIILLKNYFRNIFLIFITLYIHNIYYIRSIF